ncbi:hypothetical protein MNBD_UNCLBAC01-1175 [hydrothermal vent metagenome]|uniref:Uncharacterized protein n=1 Tax=hydrothermal vent metagenome TaxID=652676 RepID=A0A3B1DI49_9ZZZZ
MKKINLTAFSILFFLSFFLFTSPVFSKENRNELKAQIEVLQKRVEELESAQSGRDWDPFEEMGRMQEEMNRMFQNSFSRSGNSRSGRKGIFKNNMFYD